MNKNTLKFWEKIEEETAKASTWRYTAPDPFQIFVDNVIDESNEKIKEFCFELAKETTLECMTSIIHYTITQNSSITDHAQILERIFDMVWNKKIKELENED